MFRHLLNVYGGKTQMCPNQLLRHRKSSYCYKIMDIRICNFVFRVIYPEEEGNQEDIIDETDEKHLELNKVEDEMLMVTWLISINGQ